MSAMIINSPTLTDVHTMWKWGDENWQMWGDEVGKWCSKKTISLWITDPKDDVLLVVRDGKKLVGMCIVMVLRNWAFCIGLFVEEQYRGKGIGKQLLDKAHIKLKQKNIENMILLVDTKNEKALKFYKREGFTQGYPFHMMTIDIR